MRHYFLFLVILLPLLSSCQNNKTPISTQYLSTLPAPFTAPDISIKDFDGKSIKLSDYKGKPVVINFWATWCPPCRKELPSMNRAWEALEKEGVQMLAVNMSEPAVTIKKFIEKQPINFKILLDETGYFSQKWQVTGLPTTYIVDRKGEIIYKAVGEREWDNPEILATIKQLIP